MSASAHSFTIKEAFAAPFVIDNQCKPWRMYVLPNLTSNVILGQDFMSYYGATINCKTYEISWDKKRSSRKSLEACFQPTFLSKNRFQLLAMHDNSHFSLSTDQPVQHGLREHPRPRQPQLSDFVLQALKATKVNLPIAKSTPTEPIFLSSRTTFDIPALTSIRKKVTLVSASGKAISLPAGRKTGIVSCPNPGAHKDILVLEGLTYAYPDSKTDSHTYIQLSNLSSERILVFKDTKLADFEFLHRNSSVHEFSILNALPQRPPIKGVTPQKAKYLDEKVTIHGPTEFRQACRKAVHEFHDIFASDSSDIGHTDLITHEIHLKDSNQAPVYKKQFPVPWEHQKFINEKVEAMLRQGIIEESLSPYNSPIFAVKKPHSDDLRLVIDLRAINSITSCSSFRVQCVQECIDEVSKHKSSVFSTLDISQAFYQISLNKNSRQFTSFTVPGKGSFQFARLPMGLHSSPSSLSRVTNHLVKGIAGAIAYLDDVIVHSKSYSDHLGLIRQLFVRFRQFGLKLQPKKCELGAKEVTYLGYRISGEGVQAGKEKTEAIAAFPIPRTPRQVRQFCGLANYFRHMIPHFSKHSAKLTQLLTKNSSWVRGELPSQARQGFLHLRAELAKAPSLAFPDPNKMFHVFTDASLGSESSPGGLGAVLCQEGKDDLLVPVAYASRTLRDNEKGYSAFLIEMAAVVFAITHWHTYLYGRFFKVYCDHKPMVNLGSVHKRTLNRLQELMLEYNFELQYNPGNMNGPADALSRNPISALGVDVDIPSAQQSDPFCQDMFRYLQSSTLPSDTRVSNYIIKHAPQCHVTQSGILVYSIRRDRFAPRQVVIVPESFRAPLIEASHASKFSGHLGIFKTLNRLLSNYWWPGMQSQVQQFIKECHTCQVSKTPPNFTREKLPCQPLPILDSFNDRVHIDTIGKMKGSEHSWLLVITCAFSKYVVAIPLKARDAATQANAILEHWICRFGCPKTIIHDGDPSYCSELFQKLCKLLNTKTIQISSYHSQSNGSVEIYNKVFQGILRSILPSPSVAFETMLPAAQLAYNTSVNHATNSSPFFLLHGVEPRLPQFDSQRISAYVHDYPSDRFRELEIARHIARNQMEISARKNKAYYDRFTKECSFKLGEHCLLHFPRAVCKSGNPRFFKPWKPVVVMKILNTTTYVVHETGRTHKRATHVVHANRLKKYFPLKIDEALARAGVDLRCDDRAHGSYSDPIGQSNPQSEPPPRPEHFTSQSSPSPLLWDVPSFGHDVPQETRTTDTEGGGRGSPHSGSGAQSNRHGPTASQAGRVTPTPQAASAASPVRGSPSPSRSSSTSSFASVGSAAEDTGGESDPVAGVPSSTVSPATRPPPVSLFRRAENFLFPLAEAVYSREPLSQSSQSNQSSAGPTILGERSSTRPPTTRSTRSSSSAPPIPPLPARPLEYKKLPRKK